jgi:3-oxoacyl-[acyl-carrier protein] reductase
MKDLENKNIIVTGASGGIGNSIVEKLNECGANCISLRNKIRKT